MYAIKSAIVAGMARKSWDMKVLAQESGINPATIRSWLHRGRRRKVSTISAGKVASALGVDVLEVFSVDED